ncbi:MAG: tRNA (N6-threonylcarbamoyladenosine(37)-N6)-methyltransferase TrmO [Fibrobacteraceae bacterium]|nr:tRNA (N6-threonylcarbamoyladenosine(37)-N6)-methyltransferase TrmO [Fibrobacteraceae bacterium]
MENKIEFHIIAKMKSDFNEKFGIPRQSGLLKKLRSTIVFEPEFRCADALRGLEGFSHLWILWIFSENIREEQPNGKCNWSPTVRPPRLGGNKRLGVFATRSSFRPNPVAMSCVKIEEILLDTPQGPQIIVSGADLMDGTPIVDIKPYLPYADNIEGASSGFTGQIEFNNLCVQQTEQLNGLLKKSRFPKEKWSTLLEILSEDPRPAYQKDPNRVYGFKFAGHEIKFQVADNNLEIIDIL